jgi:DNA-binding NarL/FixJ family response regulator
VDVRVLVVDDQEPFRAAAEAVVDTTPGFLLVGAVATGEQAVEAAATLRPGLVLMDVVLPGIDGLSAAKQIRSAAPSVTVVLLSTYDLADHGSAVEASGAAAFVPKSAFGPDVLTALLAPPSNE